MSFRLKTILGIALIEGLLLLLLVFSSVDYLKGFNQAQIEQRAQSISAIITTVAKESIINAQFSSLRALAYEMIANNHVIFICIHNQQHQDIFNIGQECRQYKEGTLLTTDDLVVVKSDIKQEKQVIGHIELGIATAGFAGMITDVVYHFLGIALLEMLVVAVFLFLLGHFLLRHIVQLKQAAETILKGEHSDQIVVKGDDEIAQAIRAFNQMNQVIEQRSLALEHANVRLTTILSTVIDGFVLFDLQGKIKQVNSAICNMFDYQECEMLGDNISLLLPVNSHTLADDYIKYAAKKSSAIWLGRTREIQAKNLAGEVFPVEISISKMSLSGEVILICLVKDLREIKRNQAALKRSESILLATLDASLDALITLDIDGHIQEFNDAAVKLFGYQRDEVIGGCIDDFIIPKERQRIYHRAMHSFKHHQSGELIKKKVELVACHRDGHEITLEVIIIPIQMGDELILTAFMRDISERKKYETTLRRAKDQAEQGSHAKSRFLATMSHEIRSPLNAALGCVELLLATPLDKEQRIYANTAQEASNALLSVINDILDFSKIEAGQMELEVHEFEPDKLIDNVLQILAPKAQERGVTLASFVDINVPDTLMGDAQRLRQVIHNLIDNAIKFSHEGCVSIEIWLAEQQGEHIKLCCQVKDQGIGIEVDAQAELFNEFSQVHDEHNTRYQGTGLGLAICAEIIKLMGGKIQLQSEPEKGSCFSFQVLLKSTENELHHYHHLPTHSSVLLIHPEAVFTELMGRQYQQYGVQSDTYQDITACLAAATKSSYNLILIDESCFLYSTAAQINQLNQLCLAKQGEMMSMVSGINQNLSDIYGQIKPLKLVNKPLSRHMLLDLLAGENTERGVTQDSIEAHDDKPNCRILLAEDSPANQMVAGKMLSIHGYKVDYANNGIEALEMAITNHYQIILMDVRMPQMDGLQATTAILEQKPEQIIIGLSANVMKTDIERCYQVGMKDFIGKPVNGKELFSVLSRWIQSVSAPSCAAKGEPETETVTDVYELLDRTVINELQTMLGDDALKQMLGVFCEEAGQRLSLLRCLACTSNFEDVETQAHTLKSSAGSFGAIKICQLAKQLEISAREQQQIQIGLLIEQLQIEGKQTIKQLNTEFELG
ncbi:PAS domain S-box protein [Shewanella marina]|uniref:PAS domain S-box protein n=1 Tax=Shewanella marina TaxID=487319 RepID=UPI000471974C|nr:PAS domain S-box protein [Shewanella marina]